MASSVLLIEFLFYIIIAPIIGLLFLKILGSISKNSMTMNENIIFKISSISISEEIKLTARREFPEVFEYLGSLLFGKIGLEINQSEEITEIDYSFRGKKITSLIPNEQISSVIYGSRRYVLLRNISIAIIIIGVIQGAGARNSDPTFVILTMISLSIIIFIAYLIFRTSVLEIQTSGGKKILFHFSGDAEINGLSDFSKFIAGTHSLSTTKESEHSIND